MNNIKLIIGLGNPIPENQGTYHNIGHLFIDFLENSQLPITNYQLLKTNVYMNKSGLFVKEALKKYKVKPEQLLVIHDDSDIGLGKYKLSFGRGSAGHKGVQNIIAQLKTKNFWRLRVGTRPALAKPGQVKAEQLVLKKISPAARKKLESVFKQITDQNLII